MATFVAIALLILVAVLVVSQWNNRQKVLARVAHNFRGQIQHPAWSYPGLRLPIAQRPAILSFQNVGEGEVHTRLTIPWPDSLLRCEVYPQGVFSGLRKLLGVEDIEIGSPQFDAAYFITGNDRAAIRNLLTPVVQSLIMRLASLKAPYAITSNMIYIKWGNGELTITKPFDLSTYESLEEFIGLSSELVLQALGAPDAEIKFLDEPPMQGAASQCQVCGEPLIADLVYCPGCRTPHHRECWDYFGGCSTYACGKKKYIRNV